LVTLVTQGLTLQPLIRWLDLQDDGASEKEEVKARLLAAEEALQRINELTDEDWVYEDTAERMRSLYDYRRRFAARHADSPEQNETGEEEDLEARAAAFQRFRVELLGAEREANLTPEERG
jgi:monovalent cation/hydrogen antiporter